jgi:RNA-directed DNA polymerase
MKHDLTLKVRDSKFSILNGVPTSNRCFIAREFEESSKVGTQMTGVKPGAPTGDATKWHTIIWDAVRRHVRRLQMRIAKAVKEGKPGKVKSLQWLLAHSFHAKLLAVKRVTSNQGKKTPGIDGILWKGNKAKMQAVISLKRHGYNPQPLRRIYIPKKTGKKRPLSIPTMFDRAMQALYKLALSPVAETTADKNSYGFREGRSCADAVQAAFNFLSKPNSATYIFEADIDGCFDNIAKEWMLDNIPMDKIILRKWVEAGYIESNIKYPTIKGTPQGGIISPTIANMTLDGLAQVIKDAVPRRRRVNFVRYADDFIVTGKSKKILEQKVKPAIEKFLSERGLKLSEEKTCITYIKHGFTFLGQTFRKHGNTLHITPSKEGVQALIRKVGNIIRKHVSAPVEALFKQLNSVLRGWANYHRHVVSSEAFSRVDTYVFEQLWRMVRRRHQNKTRGWLIKKYWSASGKHVFSFVHKYKKKARILKVIRVSSIGIKRHIKIKAEANPYFPEYSYYFWRRKNIKEASLLGALSHRQYQAVIASR